MNPEELTKKIEKRIKKLEKEIKVWRAVLQIISATQPREEEGEGAEKEEKKREEKRQPEGEREWVEKEEKKREEPLIKKYAEIVVSGNEVRVELRTPVDVDETFERFIENKVFKGLKDDGTVKSVTAVKDGKKLKAIVATTSDPDAFIDKLSRPFVWWIKKRS